MEKTRALAEERHGSGSNPGTEGEEPKFKMPTSTGDPTISGRLVSTDQKRRAVNFRRPRYGVVNL